MLDKLIISKSGVGENKKLRRLLVSTSVIVTSLLTFALVFSLFSQNLAMGQDDLNISTLIAPPTIPKNAPPEPEATKAKEKSPADESPMRVITAQQNIQQTSQSPKRIPKTISTSSRLIAPDSAFLVGKKAKAGPSLASRCTRNCGGGGIGLQPTTPSDKKTRTSKTPKPIPNPPKITKPKKKPVKISKLLNGMAKKLVKPAYPGPAARMRIKGQVTIQITINKHGNVVAARAIKGHALLRQAATKAARASKFTPTILNGVPVKVTGVIVYNFK